MLVKALAKWTTKPPVYSSGDKQLWTDPYIATQMLEAHLEPDSAGASRTHQEIDRSSEWIVNRLGLQKGDRLLDLGCGPGLYATRFYGYGLDVTGVDFSAGSIAYARQQAEELKQDINYVQGNYLTLEFDADYDAIALIYCDLGALSVVDRDTLLTKIHAALKPGGHFVFDVNRSKRRGSKESHSWEHVPTGGFFLPTPHLLLESTFFYPEHSAYLDQYIIIDEDDTLNTIRVWETGYTPESITTVLEQHGFQVESIYADLCGNDLTDTSPILGVVCRKL